MFRSTQFIEKAAASKKAKAISLILWKPKSYMLRSAVWVLMYYETALYGRGTSCLVYDRADWNPAPRQGLLYAQVRRHPHKAEVPTDEKIFNIANAGLRQRDGVA